MQKEKDLIMKEEETAVYMLALKRSDVQESKRALFDMIYAPLNNLFIDVFTNEEK